MTIFVKQREIYNRTVTKVEPTAEPIHLDEAKLHLRVTGSDEDTFISSAITAARKTAEQITWRQYELATLKLQLDEFPQVLELEPAPVRSVESVQYIDTDGNTQTVAASNYHVDTDSEPARIWPADAFTWPIPDDRPNSVIVTFKAGYEVKFTVNDTTDTLTATDHWLSDDDVVRVRVSGNNSKALPTGLSAETDYYVINTSGDDLQLSTSSGGSAIDITDTGAGQFYIYQPPRIPQDHLVGMLLLVGDIYDNREDTVKGAIHRPLNNGARWLLGKNTLSRPV